MALVNPAHKNIARKPRQNPTNVNPYTIRRLPQVLFSVVASTSTAMVG